MPFLGFSSSVENFFFVFSGLTIAWIAYFSHDPYCGQCKRMIENDARIETAKNADKSQNLFQKKENFTSSDTKQT